MGRIEKKLNEWVKLGLITAEQSHSISAHESKKSGTSWVFYSFLLLGFLALGIGIISIIAANWSSIPSLVKIMIDFIILGVVASAIYFAKQKSHDTAFESLIVLYQILCLASIGLISQIYHTGGELHQALLFWSLITVGIAACSRKFLASFLWAGGFFTGIGFAAYKSLNLRMTFLQSPSTILMSLTLLSFFLSILGKFQKRAENHSHSFSVYTLILGVFGLISAEAEIKIFGRSLMGIRSFIPSYLLTLLIGLGIGKLNAYSKIQKLLLLSGLIVFLIPFHLQVFKLQNDVVNAILTIFILFCLAFFHASQHKRNCFQFFMIVIGLRLLGLYFQALGGLAATGFGLIASGIIVIACLVFWKKYRDKITLWAEELIK